MDNEIPDTMDKIKLKQAEKRIHGEEISIDELILQSVEALTQEYLDGIEEGHYDTATLVDNQTIEFTTATGKKAGEYKIYGKNFIDSFKKDAYEFELELQEQALKIANN